MYKNNYALSPNVFISGMKSWFNIQLIKKSIHHINRLKRKIYIIILVEAEKAFDKI